MTILEAIEEGHSVHKRMKHMKRLISLMMIMTLLFGVFAAGDRPDGTIISDAYYSDPHVFLIRRPD